MTRSDNPRDKRYLRADFRSSYYFVVRYSLEFVVVVLGITVSYWLNEWSVGQQELGHQVKDAICCRTWNHSAFGCGVQHCGDWEKSNQQVVAKP